ncbi:MAG: monofunctional biosynthetic peptidoglycan transglycosylase [Rhodoblastus sp.]
MAQFLVRIGRFALSLVLAAAVAFAALVAVWRFAPPVSTLMLARYVTGRPVVRDYVPLERISPNLIAAVVMSEDSRFCRHWGVDWQALGEVLEDEDGPSRGASTIVMQVVKNLFLWPSRSAIRKGIEIPMALVLDLVWPKRRILEAYLNVAEWGPGGIFGAEAAARASFGRSAANLSTTQAALMATALPNPILRRPGRPTRLQRKLAHRISVRIGDAAPWLDCTKP